MKTNCKQMLTGGGKIAHRNLLKALFALTLITSSCTDNDEPISTMGHPLQINVTTENIASRSIIHDSTLPDGAQIGLTMTATDGSDIEDKDYKNCLYQSKGTGSEQVWESTKSITVSDEGGLLYAYYPYSSSVEDITAIPVETASQTDYMYASSVSVSAKQTEAQLNMKHALAAVRLNIVKGDFSSDATLSTIRMRSSAMGTTAQLNTMTGALSAVNGANSWFSSNLNNIPITENPDAYAEFLVIPNGTASAAIEMYFTINGEEYTLQTTPSVALEAGNIYEYTAVLNDAEVTLKNVSIVEWTTQNKGSQNGVPYSIYVKAVKADGTLIDVADADETCIAVALLDGPKPFWIEKYESKNAVWHSNTGFYWTSRRTDLSLTNYDKAGNNQNKNWRAWGTGALSDFAGKNNTKVIVAASSSTMEMGTILKNFNAASGQNQGYSDWYIPACGQLYLIYLNENAINNALTKIGGTKLTSDHYWSSSEYTSNYGWNVEFQNGQIFGNFKDYGYRVRLVRDI